MNAASAGHVTMYVILAALFIRWLYKRVCDEEPIEIPDSARGSLELVRYSKDELREPNDSPWMDQSEWDEPRPAA